MASKLIKEFAAPIGIMGFIANFGYHHHEYLRSLMKGKPEPLTAEGIQDFEFPSDFEKNIDDFVSKIEQDAQKQKKKTFEFGIEAQGDFTYKEGEKKPTGKGVITAPAQGYKMIGEIKNGQLDGKGKILDQSNNLMYKGVLENGLLNNLGVLESGKDLKYIGNFVESKPKGSGKYMFGDGRSCIVRPAAQSDQHDFAQCYDLNKAMKYRGGWDNGNFNGKGEFYFGDGSRYQGEFNEGQMEGYGKLYDIYGDVLYRGDFEKDIKTNFVNYFSEPIITGAIAFAFVLTRLIP